MRPSALTARHALIVAPHPDDEVIGAWALMRRLTAGGARLRVLVASDGAASHPGSLRWPTPRLVRERRRETLRAMAALSIPPCRVHFLMLPDGGLEARPDRVSRAMRRMLRRWRAPDLIVGPLERDAHADHRAVARALAGVPRRGERRLGYLVWPEGGRRRAPGMNIALDGQAMRAKRRAVLGYRTQAGAITDAEAGFTMTARHLRAFVRPTEHCEILA